MPILKNCFNGLIIASIIQKKAKYLFALAAACCFLNGCMDADPLGFNRKKITDKYCLQRWEEGETRYYLFKSDQRDGVGVIEGNITKIGVSDKYIVVYVNKSSPSDTTGWYALRLSDDVIEGPISIEALQEPRYKVDVKDSQSLF